MDYEFLKCPLCGNTDCKRFKIEQNKIICGCCDSAFYKVDSENQSRLYNALDYRLIYNFDDADYLYSQIARDCENSGDIETYCLSEWGRLLCEFGVVYIKGFSYNSTMTPTFSNFKNNYDSIMQSEFYINIINSDLNITSKDYYIQQAKMLDKIYKQIKTELNQKPIYDVFICTKITTKTEKNPDSDGFTSDSRIAEKLYDEYTNNGLKVFYSAKLCEGVEYDSQIFSALLRSKKIVVISTKLEYLESCWVQSEWRRWINFIKWGDKEKSSIYLYLPHYNVKPFTLPKVFESNKIQYYTLETENTMNKLIINLGNQLSKNENKPFQKLESQKQNTVNINSKIISTNVIENLPEDAYGLFKLAYSYYLKGSKEDVIRAVELFNQAAKKGYVPAQYNLATIYMNGPKYIVKNINEAVKWYKEAAKHEDARSLYNLGYCYSKGLGVKKDLNESFKYYLMAAERGIVNAQFIIGCLYSEGIGIEKNIELSNEWFKKAAHNGDSEANKILLLRNIKI